MANLAEAIRYHMRGKSLREVTGPNNSGVSKTALQQILAGETTKPSPETLAQLAKWFASDEIEARYIYRDFMEAAGYLELMPSNSVKASGDTIRGTDALSEEIYTEDGDAVDLTVFPEADRNLISQLAPVYQRYLAARLQLGFEYYKETMDFAKAEADAKMRQRDGQQVRGRS